MHVTAIDILILGIYGVMVLGIGFALRGRMQNSSEFLLAGRHIPAWTAGLAFLSANLGAQEMIGMAASGAKYGIATSHFYWVGAIPAMVFVGVFMMPFYYGSRARSVPEYLKLRYDEKTRGFNAISFAVMTVFSSGISMYALAKLFDILLGWDFNFSIWVSGLIVLLYIYLGGLTSAIYNAVLQFFLIVLGFIPLVYLGLRDAGGWSGLTERLNVVATAKGYASGAWTDSWAHMGSPTTNPMGVEWFGMVMGLGFVLSFGYWCTDFLVVQRAMAAHSMAAARRTPLIAAVPMMLGHYFPPGLLGLGLTALMASFMSGMAGNVTAFNTVWTYDIYQSYIRKDASDAHYLWMGRMATIFGVALSVAAAYAAASFNNIMDFLQLVFAFVNAPLFATFLLGMFWKRATGHGAFFGLLLGTLAAAFHHGLTLPSGAVAGIKGGWLAAPPVHLYPSEMAQNFWTAIYAWTVCFLATIAISLLTRQKKSDAELKGLVYALTPREREEHLPWWKTAAGLGTFVLAVAVLLNVIFW